MISWSMTLKVNQLNRSKNRGCSCALPTTARMRPCPSQAKDACSMDQIPMLKNELLARRTRPLGMLWQGVMQRSGRGAGATYSSRHKLDAAWNEIPACIMTTASSRASRTEAVAMLQARLTLRTYQGHTIGANQGYTDACSSQAGASLAAHATDSKRVVGLRAAGNSCSLGTSTTPRSSTVTHQVILKHLTSHAGVVQGAAGLRWVSLLSCFVAIF